MRSEDWEIFYPDGKVEVVHNLRAWCREHKLDVGNLSRSYKLGWKCKGFLARKATEAKK